VVDPVHYRAIPTMSDGTGGAPLDLRPLFERFCEEAIGRRRRRHCGAENGPNGPVSRAPCRL
jgi:hypothetical protein